MSDRIFQVINISGSVIGDILMAGKIPVSKSLCQCEHPIFLHIGDPDICTGTDCLCLEFKKVPQLNGEQS